MRTQIIKSTTLFSFLIAFALLCKGQQLNHPRYKDFESGIYRYGNGSGFGKKVLGSLVFAGGAATSVLGVVVAVHAWNDFPNTYYTDLSQSDDWQAGKMLFMAGLVGMGLGVELIINGGVNFTSRKVSLKLNNNGVGLVVNF